MSITLFTGVPGAGKSYRLVHDLDKELEKDPAITVIANIKGLKLPHLDFDDFLLECFPEPSLTLNDRIERFFSYDYQQTAIKDKVGEKVMYVLDECQLYFPRRSSLPNTEAYFQRHRHLGHHVYMATQNHKLINSGIMALVEIEIYAVRRSASLFGELRYRTMSPMSNQLISTSTLRPKKRIFDLYRSFENEELKKPKKVMLRKLWPVLLLPAAVFLFYWGLPKAPKKETPAPAVNAQAPVVAQRVAVSKEMTERLEALQGEIEKLREQINNTERVFLSVVQHGKRKLTIDPDTRAVVELGKIKHRVICVDGGLNCYFDRPVNSGIKMAQTQESYTMPGSHSLSGMPSFSTPSAVPVASTDNRVGFSSPFDPALIPAPDKIIPRKMAIGRQE